MIEFYPQIKQFHIFIALLSGSLFALRGAFAIGGARWPNALLVKWLSYAIDTALLTAALMLLTILPRAMFANGWLAVKLGLLVVVIGVTSNLGQNYWAGPFFCGMSGVVYGLLGYVWMKSKFDPATGVFLHPNTVAMMLIWFVLCLGRVIPNVANGAHAVGLGLGVLWGFLGCLPAIRKA